ncbi:MAG: 50S ribosomal protein L17 [Patescibacteria group bacterium]|mgnify:CR=1 FL=1
MRHRKSGRKFGRVAKQRTALMKGLGSSFFIHGAIVTTEAKAKEMRPVVERAITRAKAGTLQARRILIARFSSAVVEKIFQSAEAAAGRPGGYTRIIKMDARPSDGARMARIELVK